MPRTDLLRTYYTYHIHGRSEMDHLSNDFYHHLRLHILFELNPRFFTS